MIDQSTERILIKDEQTKEGVAFSYLSGEGYYIDANVSADIFGFDLYPEIKWADFKAAGIPFRIDNYGATGCCQPITFLKKFNIIFFDSHQPFSLSKWESTVSSLVNRNYLRQHWYWWYIMRSRWAKTLTYHKILWPTYRYSTYSSYLQQYL